ncbi:MAG: crotonase/enoyl-CoA hydratase family protein, partial [bacterium]|nr:crotonase/enoyl-CoA hydratase family protein [bacterium]
VVPDGQTLAKAREIANVIAGNGPMAVRAILKSVRESFGLPEKQAFDEKEMPCGLPVFSSEDAREGPKAFLEKRKPVFQDR